MSNKLNQMLDAIDAELNDIPVEVLANIDAANATTIERRQAADGTVAVKLRWNAEGTSYLVFNKVGAKREQVAVNVFHYNKDGDKPSKTRYGVWNLDEEPVLMSESVAADGSYVVAKDPILTKLEEWGKTQISRLMRNIAAGVWKFGDRPSGIVPTNDLKTQRTMIRELEAGKLEANLIPLVDRHYQHYVAISKQVTKNRKMQKALLAERSIKK